MLRPIEIVLTPVLGLYVGLLNLLLLASWHRGDYQSDAVAAQATSVQAMQEVLDAELLIEPALRVAARLRGPQQSRPRQAAAAAGPAEGALPRLQAIRDRLAATPLAEIERLRRLDAARVGSGQILVAPNAWRAQLLAPDRDPTAAALPSQVLTDRDLAVEHRLEHLLEEIAPR